MSCFDDAVDAIDALHAADPSRVQAEDGSIPRELDYARRMTAALARLAPDASEALRLAVRAQHLERWTLPRTSYPAGKVGYHAWRTEQKARHAARAAEVMSEAGIDAMTISRVRSLIQKRDLRRDPEAQALEDAACLVFLEAQLAAFAEDRDEDQLIRILQKTWRKMSEGGRALALALPLDPTLSALVERAVGG